MAECHYLKGEALAFKTKAEAEKLIGKKVEYLTPHGIDRTGRGYIFPRTDFVKSVFGKHIEFEYAGYIHRNSITEMRELPHNPTPDGT